MQDDFQITELKKRQRISRQPLSGYNAGMGIDVPKIDREALLDLIGTAFPTADIKSEIVSNEYQSWQIEILLHGHRLEIFWGPLSGFGASHICHPADENSNPFAAYERPLHSSDDAVRFIQEEMKSTGH